MAHRRQQLGHGVAIQTHHPLPCRAWVLAPQPERAPRAPPIRFRKSIPPCWIGRELIEGKNRQVRRMTASIGHPTLRLVRVPIGGFSLGSLAVGEWRKLTGAEGALVLRTST